MSEEQENLREIARGRVDIQNVIASYIIELTEYRAGLLSAIKRNVNSPSYISEFYKAFNKVFELCVNVLNENNDKLMTEIRNWFKSPDSIRKPEKIKEGIDLSIKFQRALEAENIFVLFERPIIPPFVEENE